MIVALLEGKTVAQLRVQFCRQAGFGGQPTPGDIAGIPWRGLRQQLLAHGRTGAVGADQQVGLLHTAAGKVGADLAAVLLEAEQPFACL